MKKSDIAESSNYRAKMQAVADAVGFLKGSGYDGPFLGEAVVELFEAMAALDAAGAEERTIESAESAALVQSDVVLRGQLTEATRRKEVAEARAGRMETALLWYEQRAKSPSMPSSGLVEIWQDRGKTARLATVDDGLLATGVTYDAATEHYVNAAGDRISWEEWHSVPPAETKATTKP